MSGAFAPAYALSVFIRPCCRARIAECHLSIRLLVTNAEFSSPLAYFEWLITASRPGSSDILMVNLANFDLSFPRSLICHPRECGNPGSWGTGFPLSR